MNKAKAAHKINELTNGSIQYERVKYLKITIEKMTGNTSKNGQM